MVRIREGQIIRAILYLIVHKRSELVEKAWSFHGVLFELQNRWHKNNLLHNTIYFSTPLIDNAITYNIKMYYQLCLARVYLQQIVILW